MEDNGRPSGSFQRKAGNFVAGVVDWVCRHVPACAASRPRGPRAGRAGSARVPRRGWLRGAHMRAQSASRARLRALRATPRRYHATARLARRRTRAAPPLLLSRAADSPKPARRLRAPLRVAPAPHGAAATALRAEGTAARGRCPPRATDALAPPRSVPGSIFESDRDAERAGVYRRSHAAKF